MTENAQIEEPDLMALRAAYFLVRSDPARAMMEFEALAKSGSLMSLVYMGYMFEEGLGVEVDLAKAEELYKRAFALGSIPSATSLGGSALRRGDYEKAVEYFSWGAERHDPRAMYWLAVCYLRDRNSSEKAKAAVELLERASSLGHLESTRRLGKLLMSGRYGMGKIFRGFGLFFSTLFAVTRLVLSDPSSERLRDLPMDDATRRDLAARQARQR